MACFRSFSPNLHRIFAGDKSFNVPVHAFKFYPPEFWGSLVSTAVCSNAVIRSVAINLLIRAKHGHDQFRIHV